MAERQSARWGIAWILWCAIAMVVFLVGGSALVDRAVVTPHCVDACADEGLRFDHVRVGARSGPASACMCEGDRAIETSLGDDATFCAAMGFLAACYAPIAFADLRARRAGRRRARGTPRS